MRIYLAGPMRGIPLFNFPEFDRVSNELRLLGHEVFNPADRDREVHGEKVNQSPTGDLRDIALTGFSLRDALGADLAFIADSADLVAVLPGWKNSKGARAEVATAHALGLPVVPWDAVWSHYHATCWDRQQEILTGEPTYAPPAIDVPVIPEEITDYRPPADREGMREPAGDVCVDACCRTTSSFKISEHLTVADEPHWIPIKGAFDPPVPAPGGEVRMTSSTGAQKGSKQARFDLIPQLPLWDLAELYGRGAEKYAERNWEGGYEWSLSFAALMRHAWQFWGGEDVDEETQAPHMASVAWHAFALLEYMRTHREFDNRPVREANDVERNEIAGALTLLFGDIGAAAA